MPEALQPSVNPPIDLAVAAQVGMAREEMLRGLAEGWIRREPWTAASWTPGFGAAPPGAASPSPIGVDTLRRWIAGLDASVDGAAFDALWAEAGDGDADRRRSLARFVFDSLGVDASAVDSAKRVEARLAFVEGTGRIVRLSSRTGAELEMLARDDAGVRRALAQQSRWALSGSRRAEAIADPEGRYDRFDADTGERLLSDAWIGDRARHASWRWARDADAQLAIPGDGWRFVDRAAGPDADVEIASANGGPVHQVIFARDDGDVVSGGGTTDRLHGGGGDDVLRGRGGDDLLEGAGGDDLLAGGAGRDDLSGGRGDDELEGGAGSDRLDGGSGDDVLDGGAGSDLLRGGDGRDVYVFRRGDGIDVVDDDDGRIRIGDADVAGTMRRDGEGWRSADGRLTFEVSDGVAGSVLRIRTQDPRDAIEIRGWRPGAFGIHLEDLGDAGQASESDVEAPGAGGSVPVDADADVSQAVDSAGNAVADADAVTQGSPDALDFAASVAALLDATVQEGDASTLVDWSAVHAVLERWSIASPPDVAEVVPLHWNAPGLGEVADGVAGALGLDDGEMTLAADAWRPIVAPPWYETTAVPTPPELLPLSHR